MAYLDWKLQYLPLCLFAYTMAFCSVRQLIPIFDTQYICSQFPLIFLSSLYLSCFFILFCYLLVYMLFIFFISSSMHGFIYPFFYLFTTRYQHECCYSQNLKFWIYYYWDLKFLRFITRTWSSEFIIIKTWSFQMFIY